MLEHVAQTYPVPEELVQTLFEVLQVIVAQRKHELLVNAFSLFERMLPTTNLAAMSFAG